MIIRFYRSTHSPLGSKPRANNEKQANSESLVKPQNGTLEKENPALDLGPTPVSWPWLRLRGALSAQARSFTLAK